MEYLLVIIAAPIVVWILDRTFNGGDFSEAFLHVIRPEAKKDRKVLRRASGDDAI